MYTTQQVLKTLTSYSGRRARQTSGIFVSIVNG